MIMFSRFKKEETKKKGKCQSLPRSSIYAMWDMKYPRYQFRLILLLLLSFLCTVFMLWVSQNYVFFGGGGVLFGTHIS